MLISNHKYVYFLIFYYCKISVDAARVANKVSYIIIIIIVVIIIIYIIIIIIIICIIQQDKISSEKIERN